MRLTNREPRTVYLSQPGCMLWLLAVLMLSSCGSSSSPSVDPLMVPRLDIRGENQLQPYRADSPYASVLRQCALVEDYRQACTLDTLPFITQENPDFTREDVLDRLLVTHTWMGDRFAELLGDAPDLMIPLFGSITSISIGSTVRPSFYWAGTGAIRLDPEGLWLSVDEKANVSVEEDYRSDFGKELQFWFFESLRSGRESAIRYYSLTDRQERPYEDIKIPMYRLLYHELAHAVDFLPAQSVDSLDARLAPLFALVENEAFFLSPRLYNDFPLNSQTLIDLGQVRFAGEAATGLQKSFNSSLVGAEMANDGAARFYAYRTVREDFATLFTQVMMKFSFDLDAYIAFVDKPADEDNFGCDELLVGWGQKNRLADPNLLPRARWVINSIYGSNDDFASFFASGPGRAEPMVSGVDWCSNRDGVLQADFPGTSQTDRKNTEQTRQAQMRQLEFERRVRLH